MIQSKSECYRRQSHITYPSQIGWGRCSRHLVSSKEGRARAKYMVWL